MIKAGLTYNLLLSRCVVQVRLSIEQERAAGKSTAAAGAGAEQRQAAAAAMGAFEGPEADLASTSAPCSQSGQTGADVSQTAAAQAVQAAAEAGGEGGEVPAAGSLDIRDLGWVDRERVLRLLFAKINGKAAERRAAALPAHPYDAAIAAADAEQRHAQSIDTLQVG